MLSPPAFRQEEDELTLTVGHRREAGQDILEIGIRIDSPPPATLDHCEANAIAIRIARAASGRDKVAICGYYGWHDWYLSANLGDEAGLNGQFLPKLAPNGVPRKLKGTVFPFNDFRDIRYLTDIVGSAPLTALRCSRLHAPCRNTDDRHFGIRKYQ